MPFVDDVKTALADVELRVPAFLGFLCGWLHAAQRDPQKLMDVIKDLEARSEELAIFLSAGRTRKIRRTKLAQGRRRR